MNKGGPYDTLIEFLNLIRRYCDDLLAPEIDDALRVLEAAGKVDGGDLLASFENICCEARVTGPNVDAIRRILAALPAPTEADHD